MVVSSGTFGVNPEPLPRPAVQAAGRLPADLQHLPGAAGHRGASELPGEHAGRTDRAGAQGARQAFLCLGRTGHVAASRDGAVQAPRRNSTSCTSPTRAAGPAHDRPAGRPRQADDGQHGRGAEPTSWTSASRRWPSPRPVRRRRRSTTFRPSPRPMPGFDAAGWSGLAAPARTPLEIVAKVNKDVQALLQDPAVIRQIEQRAAMPAPGSPHPVRRVHQEGDRHLGRGRAGDRHKPGT